MKKCGIKVLLTFWERIAIWLHKQDPARELAYGEKRKINVCCMYINLPIWEVKRTMKKSLNSWKKSLEKWVRLSYLQSEWLMNWFDFPPAESRSWAKVKSRNYLRFFSRFVKVINTSFLNPRRHGRICYNWNGCSKPLRSHDTMRKCHEKMTRMIENTKIPCLMNSN